MRLRSKLAVAMLVAAMAIGVGPSASAGPVDDVRDWAHDVVVPLLEDVNDLYRYLTEDVSELWNYIDCRVLGGSC